MFAERFINSIGIQFIFAWSDGWMVQLKFETEHDHSRLMDLRKLYHCKRATQPSQRPTNPQQSEVSVSFKSFACCGLGGCCLVVPPDITGGILFSYKTSLCKLIVKVFYSEKHSDCTPSIHSRIYFAIRHHPPSEQKITSQPHFALSLCFAAVSVS